ncbi:MAG: hypothetical protein ACOZD0_05560 [Pseudomonadota bacterium]
MPEGQQVTVMVKLHRHDPVFAALPMSNERGNARALAFAAYVDALLLRAAPDQGQARIIQRAANVGVFVVQASTGVIEPLLALPEVQTADLMQSSGPAAELS